MTDVHPKREDPHHTGLSRRRFLGMAGLGALGTGVLADLTRRDAAAQAGGTVVVGMEAESDIMDPHVACCGLTYRVNRQMFEGLVKEDLSRTDVNVPPLAPCLATSWTLSEDRTQYTFRLRDGVKFHDGTPLDAEAVKFNFDRFADKSAPQFYPKANAFTFYVIQFLEKTEVVDPSTIRITLSKPFEPFLRIMCQSCGEPLMISPAAIKKYGNDGLADHPVGTGPFRFRERVLGDRIVMERNPDYWGAKARSERLVWKPMPDPAARVAALEQGAIDMALAVPPDSVDLLKKMGYVVEINRNIPHVWYLNFNMRDPVVRDKRVRQAIYMAINREEMSKTLLRGTCTPAWGLIPPGTEAYDPAFKGLGYDPAKAKALLAAAGYAKGLSTTMGTSVSGSGQIIPVPIMEWIKRDLEKVNVSVEIKSYEWLTWLRDWIGGLKPPMGAGQMSWGMSTDYWVYMTTHSRFMPPKGVNVGWYTNPKVDALLDQVVQTFDTAKRRQLYQQIDRVVIVEDTGFLPVVNDAMPTAWSAKVHGFVLAPQWWWYMDTVSKA
jgi:peptide/nickel transport system substrate-binding protein